uniref:RING-CH-type domain-containing protein n=1 Tax=Heterorhabditis bacteriophora TaxID=37862 RepID=A0A1I7WRN9_HETBA
MLSYLFPPILEYSTDVDSYMDKAPSQLGILCHNCSTTDLPCLKSSQKINYFLVKEHGSPSLPSLYSLAPSDLSGNEPICRICHCCWPSDATDPLISPCRCSGSLQYVHVSCLMHWLDISSRKLHRPAVCELCLYKYRRRRVLKYREIKLPDCADKDVRYYTLFISALILMILSALATVICFQLEKTYGVQSNRTVSTSSTLSDVSPELSDSLESIQREEVENLLSTVTLVAAVVFFFSFFMAMYAHVKSRDSQYLSKLEELRRKINGILPFFSLIFLVFSVNFHIRAAKREEIQLYEEENSKQKRLCSDKK